MDPRTAAVACAVAGLVLVAVAGVALTPFGDRPMVVTHVDGIEDPGPADVAYGDLPPSAQAAVDDALEDGYASLSTYEDYTAVTALRGEHAVRRGSGTYLIRTTSADGHSLVDGTVHSIVLAVGGALVGFGASLRARRQSPGVATLAIPVGATVAILGVNALAAPRLSLVSWFGLASFGLATAVAPLAGIAVGRRDRSVGALAFGTLCFSVGVLLLGEALSALYLLIPLVVLGVPGLALGWRLDRAVDPPSGPADGNRTPEASR